MFPLPPKAHVWRRERNVRQGPIAGIGAGKAQPVEMRNFGQFHRKAHACLTSPYDSISHIAQSSQRPRGGSASVRKFALAVVSTFGPQVPEFRARNGLTLFLRKLPDKESWGSLSPIPDLIDSWVTLWRALWGFVFRGDPLLAWPHESVRAVVFEVCQSVAGGLDDRGQG